MTKTATLLASLVGPCPECGDRRLHTVFDGALINLLCRECGARWHPEVAAVRRVDPAACAGCGSRLVCEAGARL